MNNNTNKKKLELRKTAIANLTLSEEQMRMVIGGVNMENTPITESRDLNGLTDCQNNSKGFCIPDEKKTR